MRNVSAATIRKRIVTAFLIGILCFVIIDIRLGYVQFVIGDDLSDKANESWTRDIVFEAERGLILDENEEVLAENVTAPSVVVVPRQIDNPKQSAGQLADILDMSESDALEYVTQNASSVSIHPEGRKISEKQEQALRTLDLDGVYLAKDSRRHYPNGNELSHVLGFAGIDNQGLMGLEQYYDDKLSGEPGQLSYYSDAKGRRMDTKADQYTPPEDGLNLKTTINSKVQSIMERELDLADEKYNPDRALSIAVNPQTGGVLGMASRPDFNPENYQEVDSDIYDRNLPIWSTFEPGSTFKIITLASALEEQAVDLQEDQFYDDGSIEVDGANLKCWKSGGHGKQTYKEVVQNSCNPGFVTLGQELGKEKLFSYIKKFGFGKKTGIDLKGEGNGILFDMDQVGPVELGTTSFGQGVSVTPIQQVMAVSAAINGGYLYEPFIADEWLDPTSGDTVKSHDKELKRRVISSETSNTVRKTLESVVAKGTGRPAYVDGYRVGGKTGTAQKVGPDGNYLKDNYILSFIGFAPADDPEIVVFTAIDNPKDTIQFGGQVAGPIVGTILEDSLQALDVKRREEGLEKEHQWPDTPKVEVPDLIGKEKSDLQEYMTTLAIETSGEGDTIVDQAPEAGVKIEEGETVRIYLGEKNHRD